MGGGRRRWPRPVGALALVLALAAGCTVRLRPEPAPTSTTARPTTRAPSVALIDIRPRGVGTVTADRAWMRFDVTELYRTWAEGGPFPSQQHTVKPGTPLVVDVRPDSFAEPYFEVRFAPLGRDAGTAPQLRWTAARGC